MGSRLRENPGKLFDVFVEIAKPDTGQDAFILQMYPQEYDDTDVLKQIPKFVYPCEMDCTVVDHFTFVLTDLESRFRFGFCRHATGAQTCLCIISVLPWYEVFYKQLNLLAEILNRTENNDLTPLLESMYNHEVPMSGVPVTIVAQQEMFSFTSPDLNQLPSIPASRNLTEYYNAVDTNNMMVIFASMLNERRVIFTSKKLSRLTACIHGAESLLYPMHWQHLYIPVLPSHLLDYVTAPMPYVIGVHTAMLSKVKTMEIGDAVIIDTDKNSVETEHDDLEALPEEVSAYLKKHLKGDRVTRSMLDTGDAISRAFLNALVRLIGGYRDALKFRTGEPITFDPDAFVQSRSPSMQTFLENMLQLQIFQQFINGRLDNLNCGNGFSDLFEKEAVLHADKLNTDSKYKEWVSNMKRQGKKFQKSGKEVFSDVKERAPIMMNSAVQSMKSQGKKAISGFKAKMNEENAYKSPKEDVYSIDLKPLQINDSTKNTKGHRSHHHSHRTPDRQRPATIIGSNLKGMRPPRPSQPPNLKAQSLRPTTSYKLIDVTEDESNTDEDSLTYQRVSVNLMSDPDIQQACQRSASSELISDRETPSDDSSSVDTPSSGAQTPAEMEDTGIPYVDLESNATRHTNNTQTNFAPLPRSSPVIKRANGAPCVAIQGPPPIPAPRSRSSNVTHGRPPRPKPKPKDEQLIRFDSVESETSTQFDPFAQNSNVTSQASTLDSSFEGSPNLERSRPQRRSLINRSPAFRQPGQDTPKRNTYKPDHSPEPSTGEGHPSAMFDPLAGFDKAMYPDTKSQPKPETEEPKSPSLLQNWSFSQLTSSPVVTPPFRPPIGQASSSTNPAYNMTMPMRTPPVPAPKPRHSTSNSANSPLYKDANKSNPLHVPPRTNTSGKKSPSPTPQKNDPFSDLLDLHIGPQITKPTVPPSGGVATKTKTWETFD